MLVLADLYRRAGSGSITVRSTGVQRSLHVEKGHLVAADSSVQAERLGDMLGVEGRLDPILIEPVATEAKRRGKLLGDQLVADGLLTAPELASALERQATLRFGGAVGMPGNVTLSAGGAPMRAVRHELGSAILAQFRERVALEPVAALLADRVRDSITLDLESEHFKRLRLASFEARVVRRLAAGEALDALVASSDAPEPIVRLAGALVALGLWA